MFFMCSVAICSLFAVYLLVFLTAFWTDVTLKTIANYDKFMYTALLFVAFWWHFGGIGGGGVFLAIFIVFFFSKGNLFWAWCFSTSKQIYLTVSQ